MWKKKVIGVLVCLTLIGCGRSQQGTESIQIKGSDTMVNLVQGWAEGFMKDNPNSFVAVTGGGSGTGIASLLNKTCNIASCSRKMEVKELTVAKSKGIQPKEFIVGFDGIAVVVHPSNPIEKLTTTQLANIFTGKMTNWKDIGGREGKIVVLSREVNSGTYVYFKEHVLGDSEYTEEALLLPSSQAIADEVAQNPNAIGYYGLGYISPNQKVIAIAKDEKSSFIKPSIVNVKNSNYYISRPLLMYTNGEPSGVVKRFMDFVMSEDGQKIVEELDFVPIN